MFRLAEKVYILAKGGAAAMSESDSLTSSQEDYLEAIYHIEEEKKAARAKDIALRLGVNNSSVTGAMRFLSAKGLVNYAPYDLISLTDSGRILAQNIVKRHEALLDFFIKVLCISSEEAENAACRMEHAMPATILDRLRLFVEFLDMCPRAGARYSEDRGYFCLSPTAERDCQRCVTEVSRRLRTLAGS
ncbi:MAG: Transcriptional regulator MntR [candidate division BRC1 bacterium ADurb.BinA364]|nr:MAG: Transcriptional regulator MntR [candidate division BRC1 bacterium ADurb.BinA364]